MIHAGLIPSLCNNLGDRSSKMYLFDPSVTDQQIKTAMDTVGNLDGLPFLGTFNVKLEARSDGETNYVYEAVATSTPLVGQSYAYNARAALGDVTVAEASYADFQQYVVRKSVRRVSTMWVASQYTYGVAAETIRASIPAPTSLAWVNTIAHATVGSELLEPGIDHITGIGDVNQYMRMYPIVLDYGKDVTFDSFFRQFTSSGYAPGHAENRKFVALAAWIGNAWTIVTPTLRADSATDAIMLTKFAAKTSRYWCILPCGNFQYTSGQPRSVQSIRKFGLSLSSDPVSIMEEVTVGKAVVLSPLAADTPQEGSSLVPGQGYAILSVGTPDSVGTDLTLAESVLKEDKLVRLLECKIEVVAI